ADVEPVFLKSCVGGCHEGSNPPLGLSLEASKAYAQIVNVPAKSACTSQMRVLPGDPDHSVIFLTMTKDTCVRRMPVGDPTYFDSATAELATVRTWIQNGAPNN